MATYISLHFKTEEKKCIKRYTTTLNQMMSPKNGEGPFEIHRTL